MAHNNDNDERTAEFDDTECIAYSPKAILVRIDGAEHWIPQSQIDDDSEVWKKGDTGKLVISTWFAIKAGLV